MLNNTLFKYAASSVIVVLAIWLLYAMHIQPLLINATINNALVSCTDFVEPFEVARSHSAYPVLDTYATDQYLEHALACIPHLAAEQRNTVATKAIELLQKRVTVHEHDARPYIVLGTFTNLLLAATDDSEERKALAAQAKEAFQTASRLSPKREEIDERIVYTLILEREYALAKEAAAQCQERFPENTECVAWGVVAELWLGERDSLRLGSSPPPFDERIPFHFYTPIFLNQILKFYVEQENYEQLIEVYIRLIRIEEKPQYYGALAFSYAQNGEWAGAAVHAFRMYQLQPTAKEEVYVFLKDVLAKDKAHNPILYDDRLKAWQPYKDIEKAFPGIFDSL